MVKIGINGFGRIGRLLLRAAHYRCIPVVGINNPKSNPEYLAYMLKFDSVHGRFRDRICMDDKNLILKGKTIKLFHESDPSKIKWADCGAKYIAECSGKFNTAKGAKKHLRCGVRRVVLSAPAKKVPNMIVGVNLNQYKPKKMRVISCASCTANALAPLLKLVHETFCVQDGVMMTILPSTSKQHVIDSPSPRSWRNGRAATCNVLPTATDAGKILGTIIPALKGKIHGVGYRVPVSNVSLLDVGLRLKKEIDMDCLKDKIKEAGECQMRGVLGYTEHNVASTDFIGDPHSVIFDAAASTCVSPHYIKLVGWYDNEWAYANRMLDLLLHMHKVDKQAAKKKNKCAKKKSKKPKCPKKKKKPICDKKKARKCGNRKCPK